MLKCQVRELLLDYSFNFSQNVEKLRDLRFCLHYVEIASKGTAISKIEKINLHPYKANLAGGCR
jgi:hypothetical protein